MAEHGFTRGPWAVSKNKARKVTSSGVVICNAVLRNQGGPKHKAFLKDEQEAEANARLIAASPTLLEALQDAIGALEMDYEYGCDSGDSDWEGLAYQRLQAARAAITLATGKDA